MKLHTLKPAEGSTKAKKRVGRGQGSGQAELQQEDTKELSQDLVINRKIGFEGGQMPLQRRVPKLALRTLTELNTRV